MMRRKARASLRSRAQIVLLALATQELSESVRGERGMDWGGAWGGVGRGLLTLLLLPLLSSYLVSI